MSNFVMAAIDLAHCEMTGSLLQKAKAIADLEGLPLAVITVIPDFGMSIVGTFFKQGAEKEALDLANQTLHKIVERELGSGVNVKHIIKHGTAYEEILSTAREINASTIVIGANRPELQDYLLGPNAARVVRHSTVSVYVVRQ